MMRTLFLQAPSFDGFDGGAGSRYQARREVRSFWYPTWLAQPAALIEGSKLIDAPSHGLKLSDITPIARDYDLPCSPCLPTCLGGNRDLSAPGQHKYLPRGSAGLSLHG